MKLVKMKLVKTASGKQTIKISKSDWESIGRTAGWTEDKGREFEYVINLDERGEFYADVRGPEPEFETVFEIKGFDIFEDGFMKHKEDIAGLEEHLKNLGVIGPNDTLISG